jgi:copper chaperone CopZ
MKKLLLVLSMVAGITTVSHAQLKKSSSQTAIIKTPTVQCGMCKKRIEDFMAKEEGVVRTVVDYKRKTTKVTYYTTRTNLENIKTAIANVGYDAEDVTANVESYQKLPKCCKKPEDGGGMSQQ